MPSMSVDTCSGVRRRDVGATFTFNVSAGQIDYSGTGLSQAISKAVKYNGPRSPSFIQDSNSADLGVSVE